MRPSRASPHFFSTTLLYLLTLSVAASPAWSGAIVGLAKRDEHRHMHHAAPLAELNESAILLTHAPTPPSYWTIDIDEANASVPRYPGLMALHAIFMGLAFFVALPMRMSHHLDVFVPS